MATVKKKPAKSPSPTKSPAKTAAGKVGDALASTASFAAGIVRETGELIRDLASSVTKGTELGPSPGATDLLVHQHRLVEGLFERLESSKRGFDQTLRELADDLTAHISIEEHLFYPAVRKVNPDLILEGLEEHAMGRFALRRLLGTRASDKELKARLEALKELMTNHHHEEEHDLFPAVKKHGASIVVGGPFNSGILVGGKTFNYAKAPPEVVKQVRRIDAICKAHRVPLAAAALQFTPAHPIVASVIPGPRTAAELRQIVRWWTAKIPAALWSDLKSEGALDKDAPVPK